MNLEYSYYCGEVRNDRAKVVAVELNLNKLRHLQTLTFFNIK